MNTLAEQAVSSIYHRAHTPHLSPVASITTTDHYACTLQTTSVPPPVLFYVKSLCNNARICNSQLANLCMYQVTVTSKTGAMDDLKLYGEGATSASGGSPCPLGTHFTEWNHLSSTASVTAINHHTHTSHSKATSIPLSAFTAIDHTIHGCQWHISWAYAAAHNESSKHFCHKRWESLHSLPIPEMAA